MKLDEIRKTLLDAGLISVLVDNDLPDDDRRLGMVGGLSEYVEVLQKTGGKLVVVFTEKLSEESFYYDPEVEMGDEQEDDEEEDDKADTPEGIDLCRENKALMRFKEFLWQRERFGCQR